MEAKKNNPEEYRKVMTRSMYLLDCELWDIGDRILFPKKFKNLTFFDPLFIYTPGKAVSAYYNFTDPKQSLQPLIEYLEKNIPWVKEEKIIFDNNCDIIRKMVKSESTEYAKLYNLIKDIWPMIAMANSICMTEIFQVGSVLKNICVAIREDSDDVLHAATLRWIDIITTLIPDKKYADRILYKEFIEHKMPSDEELNRRAQGWFLHNGKIGYNIEEYCKQKNIIIVNDDVLTKISTITGKSACKGVVEGRVKIIFELSELDKIEKGDILVSPMTTPEMMIALKKAAAIVTDEGGITCHAAIVSRELNIPCITGTKIATKALKDGDIVKVDANEGIITILN